MVGVLVRVAGAVFVGVFVGVVVGVLVRVAVGVLVGRLVGVGSQGLAPYSNAPLSQAPFAGRGAPRWSVVTAQLLASMRSIAGLPASSA